MPLMINYIYMHSNAEVSQLRLQHITKNKKQLHKKNYKQTWICSQETVEVCRVSPNSWGRNSLGLEGLVTTQSFCIFCFLGNLPEYGFLKFPALLNGNVSKPSLVRTKYTCWHTRRPHHIPVTVILLTQ